MEADRTKNFLNKLIALAISVIKWIGSIILAIMMFLTAIDVTCRYIFNRPILGAMELVEYMMAILIPFSVAYCAFCKSHVAVEFILDQFPRKVQKFVDIPIKIITFIFLGIITWETCLYVVETYRSGLTSAVLLIIAYPFVIPIVIGMGLFSLIVFTDLLPGSAQKEDK